jgi:hypothetical protein
LRGVIEPSVRGLFAQTKLEIPSGRPCVLLPATHDDDFVAVTQARGENN